MRNRYTEYRIIGSDEKDLLFKKAAITVDTNILLALYRQSSRGAQQLLAILDRIKERLWVPDHVIYEFMKNRPSVMYGNGKNDEDLHSILTEFQGKFSSTLNEYINRVVIDPDERDEYRQAILSKLTELNDSVASIETAPERDVENDDLLAHLEDLLDGRIGEPATKEELRQWDEEFINRAERLIPPGYKDVAKGDNASGDLIIWKQLLKDAGNGQFPEGLLVVTSDVKEDMYWRVKGRNLGPRTELKAEFSSHAPNGETFWQISLGEFVLLAGRLLSVEIDDVNTAVSDQDGTSRSLACGTWDPNSYYELIERLETGGYSNQVQVIEQAAKNGGFITRTEIYEICQFDKPRLLNGFSQPVNRIHRDLLSSEDNQNVPLETPMNARYSRPGKTIGYEVPLDFTFFVLRNYTGWAEWEEDDPETLNDPEFLELAGG